MPPPQQAVLYISGLALGYRARDLASHFERYGPIVRCDIPAPPANPRITTCFAFIEFEDSRDAQVACDEMNGRRVDGMVIKVEWAKNAPGRNWRFDVHKKQASPPPHLREEAFSERRPGHFHSEDRQSDYPPRHYSRSPPPLPREYGYRGHSYGRHPEDQRPPPSYYSRHPHSRPPPPPARGEPYHPSSRSREHSPYSAPPGGPYRARPYPNYERRDYPPRDPSQSRQFDGSKPYPPPHSRSYERREYYPRERSAGRPSVPYSRSRDFHPDDRPRSRSPTSSKTLPPSSFDPASYDQARPENEHENLNGQSLEDVGELGASNDGWGFEGDTDPDVKWGLPEKADEKASTGW